ncbi:hypothetical protein GW17_00034829 [Ensete ventricosum]|uniref:Uncharacterized protein n=1 Tax=Ensete ventricosum TaxID=4639 RepID=A0A444DVF9_ENSVE|nr:hypothetical protein GW17_00034829 [Ensete ventricosum]RZR75477.1 hypothetical protein BHM03_00058835 [Ensete ventricosum]
MDLPCAACRTLHRKCDHGCLLAPYFPADESDKFASVHKVFGASNVVKMLRVRVCPLLVCLLLGSTVMMAMAVQVVKEGMKEDAIKSMVYEAHARLQDPVYGCAGIVLCLQRCVEELQGQLRPVHEQVLEAQLQRDQLVSALMGATEVDALLYAHCSE